jgi:hypothetical protein
VCSLECAECFVILNTTTFSCEKSLPRASILCPTLHIPSLRNGSFDPSFLSIKNSPTTQSQHTSRYATPPTACERVGEIRTATNVVSHLAWHQCEPKSKAQESDPFMHGLNCGEKTRAPYRSECGRIPCHPACVSLLRYFRTTPRVRGLASEWQFLQCMLPVSTSTPTSPTA